MLREEEAGTSPGKLVTRSDAMTHILGDHARLVIHTAKHCHPSTHTPLEADALLEALLHCMNHFGGTNQAARPRAASPDKPAVSNRTRTNTLQAAPMNPVNHHYGTGTSGRPPGDTDAGYWRHQYERVSTHFDRCEVIRRAATFLASLVQRDPNAPTGTWTDQDIEHSILIEGHGWPMQAVAERFHCTQRTVALARILYDRHPLTGKHWTPPEHNRFAAIEAREMRDHGMTSTDIAQALGCSSSAVRMWTTKQRRAA